jgi:hypothetical protein
VILPRSTYAAAALCLLLAVDGILHTALAQNFGNGNHTVTVRVSPVTALQLSSGSVNLNITGATAVAGQDVMRVIDASTQLFWGVNSSAKKITVASSLAAPQFTLKLVALNPTKGTPSAEFVLNAAGHDLLLNIGRTSGGCSLRYTAEALASQGTGNDLHVITFTVVTQ